MNTRRHHNSKQAHGFSLIEVLAAIVLAAIVLPVAMRGIAAASSVASLSRKRIEATHLAEYKLNELLLTKAADAQQGGDFTELSDRFDAFTWNSTADDYDTDKLKQINVAVLFNHNGRQQNVTLQTVLYMGDDE